MNRTFHLVALLLILLPAAASAASADAARVEKTYQLSLDQWTQDLRGTTSAEARAKAWAARPDPAAAARQMWAVISPALREPWTLEPAAWYLSIAAGLRSTLPNGSSSLTFAEEIKAIYAAVETYHMQSSASPATEPAKLPALCLAMAANDDPRSLSLLEKIQTAHADKKVRGVAALAIAMRLKFLGDDPGLMSKRLTLLRSAIIDSAEVEIHGVAVAKLAEDELYIIRFLTKGRVAPDLSGVDSGSIPMKLSSNAGKVVVLLFWNSGVPEAARVLEMTSALTKKFAGKPFALIGINNDSTASLREMQKQPDLITFPNFSDPQNQLAHEYRIGAWPLAYILDGQRKIHYAGPPGSFVDITVAALLEPSPPAAK
ncbi:MAG: redoxin domain-containing protein [Verrucomicrobia bacterium]|nr:MAG: redoxin domain-containing protein [Verrucomicrobiota bacterium]